MFGVTPVHRNNTCYIDNFLQLYNAANKDANVDAYRSASMYMGIVQRREATFYMHKIVYIYIYIYIYYNVRVT
jgi:hypothetical protein